MSRTAVRSTPITVDIGVPATAEQTMTLGLAQLDDERWIFGLIDSYATERIGWISYEWDPAEWTERLQKVAERGYFCFYSGDRHQTAIVASYADFRQALRELGLVL
jgi:hypothetical protein